MEQKKFMDISRIKEDTELTVANTGGFHVGDHIVIQEKVDGSNSAIAYDKETNKLVAFSRRQTLDYNNTLNGFWNWVQTLAVEPFSKYPNYVFFGNSMILIHTNINHLHIVAIKFRMIKLLYLQVKI